MARPDRLFHWILGLTFAARLGLAAWLPMTGDEAYYVAWGRHPSLGYYDQPPMVGWWLAALLWVSDARVWLRLPAVLLPVALGLGLRKLLPQAKSNLGASLFLLAPLHALPPLITTDTPLIFFSAISSALLLRATRGAGMMAYAGAGAALGLGFLSKYFALLVPAAFFVWLILERRPRRDWVGFALMLVFALPAAWIHLHWNSENCWANFYFNLVKRHGGESFSAVTFGTFWAYQVYLATPFLLYLLVRNLRGKEPVEIGIKRSPELRLVSQFFLIPLCAFALSALKYPQGLHWMLAFYPAFYLYLGWRLPEKELRLGIKLMAAFLAMHLLPLLVYVLTPGSAWEGTRYWKSRVLFHHGNEVAAAVEAAIPQGTPLATDGYTLASVLGYHLGRDVAVLGTGSRFGRHDDWVTDFAKLEGKTIAYVVRARPPEGRWSKYFESSEIRVVTVRGVDYFVLLGHGFNYVLYRIEVLGRIRARYYALPPKYAATGCPFAEKYFEAD
ncbi:MAG: glycosyltransferase family 39 protein [Bdellovibrionales bacterium]|nr:glycosyltransferase family 39 protein [Bdellovibrionales bacterium]